MRPNKKGVLDNLGNLVTVLAGLAIVIAVIFMIIAETKTQVLSMAGYQNDTNSETGIHNDSQYNITFFALSDTQEAMSDIPGWLPIIVITIIGGILLTLVRFFRGSR